MYDDNQNDVNNTENNNSDSSTENRTSSHSNSDSTSESNGNTSYRMNKDSIQQDFIPTNQGRSQTGDAGTSENGYTSDSYQSGTGNGGSGWQAGAGNGAGNYQSSGPDNNGWQAGAGSGWNQNNGYGSDSRQQYYSYESGPDYGNSANSSRKMNRRQRRASGYRGSGRGNGQRSHGWRRLNVFAKSAICAVIIGAIGGGMIFGSFALGRNVFGGGDSASISTTTDALDGQDSSSSSSGKSSSSGSSSDYTVSQIAAKCTDSVVAITNKGVTETQDLFGQTYSQESTSAGSGVIIGKSNTELLIVTNYHVIEDSNKLTVCFEDSKTAVYSANIKGTDSKNDLAVVAVKLSKIDSDVLNKVKIATIGDSNNLKVGEQVVAIGNALGYGQSVTSGYVSALNRTVSTSSGNSAKLLQTDAAINPGNSGGALFNMRGELVGINTAKYSNTSVEGMGFAIPISTAKSDIQKLMNETTRSRLSSGYGYLGIYGQDVDSDASQSYNIPTGVYVSEVIKNSAAQKAGIQKGDVIVEFGGSSIDSMESLQQRLQYYKAGEKVKMVYARNSNGTYKEHTVTVTLGNEKNARKSSSSSSGGNNGSGSSNGNSGYGSGGSGSYGSGSSGDSTEDFFSQFFE